jgi:hypothetical protein
MDYREPHEFGAFWRGRLQMRDMSQPPLNHGLKVDWNNLSAELDAISKVFAQPVVYKAFHLSWFIKEMSIVSPNSKWIFIRRNTIENARSLLDARRHLYGDINKWASSRPYGIERYCDKGPYLEVVAQVELINHWIESQLEELGSSRHFTLSLEDLVSGSIGVFSKIATWSNIEVDSTSIRKVTDKIFPEVFDNDQEYKNIQNAYQDFLSLKNG